jgi:hypothetical protein
MERFFASWHLRHPMTALHRITAGSLDDRDNWQLADEMENPKNGPIPIAHHKIKERERLVLNAFVGCVSFRFSC